MNSRRPDFLTPNDRPPKGAPYVSKDGSGTIVHCRECGCPDFEAHRKNGTIGVRCQGCLLPLLVVTVEDKPQFVEKVVDYAV